MHHKKKMLHVAHCIQRAIRINDIQHAPIIDKNKKYNTKKITKKKKFLNKSKKHTFWCCNINVTYFVPVFNTINVTLQLIGNLYKMLTLSFESNALLIRRFMIITKRLC